MDAPEEKPASFVFPSEETSFSAAANRPRKPKRLWIVSVLIVATVMSVCSGGLGYFLWREQQQKDEFLAAKAAWEKLDPKFRTIHWLRRALKNMPGDCQALFLAYEDVTEEKERWIVFTLNGFEGFPDGTFDPTNPDHERKLLRSTWDYGGDCKVRFSEHPDLDWTAFLDSAADDPEIASFLNERDIQLVIAPIHHKRFHINLP